MRRFVVVCLFGLFSATGLSAQQYQPKIDEIVLEAKEGTREADFRPDGPSFKITLSRDGSALFTGKAKVKLIGNFQGIISKAEFEKLANYLVAQNFARVVEDPINANRITPAAGSARISVYDAFSTQMITDIRYSDGKRKTISHPTDVNSRDQMNIPKELLKIEQAIFDAATRISCSKVN